MLCFRYSNYAGYFKLDSITGRLTVKRNLQELETDLGPGVPLLLRIIAQVRIMQLTKITTTTTQQMFELITSFCRRWRMQSQWSCDKIVLWIKFRLLRLQLSSMMLSIDPQGFSSQCKCFPDIPVASLLSVSVNLENIFSIHTWYYVQLINQYKSFTAFNRT